MQRHILIVENDLSLAKTLVEHLSAKKHLCTTVATTAKAFEEIEQYTFDLVIVDRVLDDGDGIEVVDFLHLVQPNVKVLILSSKGAVADRVKGLESGADDYLPKPFSLVELTIKVEKMLNIEKMAQPEELRMGALSIKPQSGEVLLNTVKKVMRKKECAILTYLVRHKNQVLSRERIIETVWGYSENAPTSATLDVYIRRIRMFLGEHKDFIQTVRGFGYVAQELEVR